MPPPTGRLLSQQVKFLIGRDGVPIRRYVSSIPPSALADDIAAALAGRTLGAPPLANASGTAMLPLPQCPQHMLTSLGFARMAQRSSAGGW